MSSAATGSHFFLLDGSEVSDLSFRAFRENVVDQGS